ncbi:MAG: type II toxin-antitoxin system death-on-curing family toxin [Chloroflexi bacterium]|nr:type II toxin-antitoxin system death-on-curing family toxin [Chloroflexota bacterium]
MEPVFLELGEVIEIHDDQIKRYGGRAGIRDLELLKSAIAMPAAGFSGDYFHADIYEMAAAYLFHLVRNHPFIDGNKRTGAVASVVFLLMNGIELQADEDAFEKMVLSVVEGKSDKAVVSRFFRDNAGTTK